MGALLRRWRDEPAQARDPDTRATVGQPITLDLGNDVSAGASAVWVTEPGEAVRIDPEAR